jgi:hypothetical protein
MSHRKDVGTCNAPQMQRSKLSLSAQQNGCGAARPQGRAGQAMRTLEDYTTSTCNTTASTKTGVGIA